MRVCVCVQCLNGAFWAAVWIAHSSHSAQPFHIHTLVCLYFHRSGSHEPLHTHHAISHIYSESESHIHQISSPSVTRAHRGQIGTYLPAWQSCPPFTNPHGSHIPGLMAGDTQPDLLMPSSHTQRWGLCYTPWCVPKCLVQCLATCRRSGTLCCTNGFSQGLLHPENTHLVKNTGRHLSACLRRHLSHVKHSTFYTWHTSCVRDSLVQLYAGTIQGACKTQSEFTLFGLVVKMPVLESLLGVPALTPNSGLLSLHKHWEAVVMAQMHTRAGLSYRFLALVLAQSQREYLN